MLESIFVVLHPSRIYCLWLFLFEKKIMYVLLTILWFLGCRNILETAEIMELSLDPGIDIYICGDEAVEKK